MNWNTDISQAPRGKTVETTVLTAKGPRPTSRFVPDRVILATKCGKVVLSHYLPEKKRWMMLGEGEQPTAWMAWPDPFISPSDGDAISEVKGIARPENAAGVEPSLSGPHPQPSSSPVTADKPEVGANASGTPSQGAL